MLIPSKVYLGDCHVCVSSGKFKLIWFVIKSRDQWLFKNTELVVSRAGLKHKSIGKSSWSPYYCQSLWHLTVPAWAPQAPPKSVYAWVKNLRGGGGKLKNIWIQTLKHISIVMYFWRHKKWINKLKYSNCQHTLKQSNKICN